MEGMQKVPPSAYICEKRTRGSLFNMIFSDPDGLALRFVCQSTLELLVLDRRLATGRVTLLATTPIVNPHVCMCVCAPEQVLYRFRTVFRPVKPIGTMPYCCYPKA